MLKALKFIHLFSIAVWIGMLVFFTFIVAPSVFKAFPKDMAGDFVGVIFPNYWVVGYAAGVLSLGSLVLISMIEKAMPIARIALLVSMTGLTFYSGLVVSARAREVKQEIRVVEEGGKKTELTGEFKRLHARSSVMNLAVIIFGIVVIYLTAVTLRL